MGGKKEKPTNSKPENQIKPEQQNPNEPKLPEPDLDKITTITKGIVNPEEENLKGGKKIDSRKR
jgi:hypothetical protein